MSIFGGNALNYSFNWSMFASGEYHDWIVEGIETSINLMVVSSVLAVVVGVLLTFLSLSRHRVLRGIAQAYVELCRNIPTLLWIVFFFFVVPNMLPPDISYNVNRSPHLGYAAAIAGLSISSSGYIGEILRGGIMAVPKEQGQAAYALGLSKMQTWWHVTMPQALRNCFPALVNRIIHNVQNTSLAMTISVHEIMCMTSRISSITFHGIETMLIATVFFVLCCFVIEFAARLVEKHLLPIYA